MNRLDRIRLAAQKAGKDDQALVAMVALLDPEYVLKMCAVIEAARDHVDYDTRHYRELAQATLSALEDDHAPT